MQLSKNFTLEEMVRSSTAKRKGIDNRPADLETLNNLSRLVNEVLQPIRDVYGKPIVVGSGFRCPRLNKAVGGVANSDHQYGCAADIHSLSDTLVDNMELWLVIMKMAKAERIHCRQVIFEYGDTKFGPDWIHISINNSHNGKKDNQVVYIKPHPSSPKGR